MKKSLIIDCMALLGSLTGIGRYNYEITQILSRLEHYDLSFFYGYTSKHFINPKSSSPARFTRKILIKNYFLKRMLRKFLYCFNALARTSYDLYWQPNFIPLRQIKAKKIIASVHDFSWENFPQYHPKERIDYFKNNFYHAIKYCDHLITGTLFTKNEIIERTGFSPDKISVIYHGVNHALFYPRKPSDQHNSFILAVGSIEPRKNLKNLLLAYAALELSLKQRYALILVGAEGWQNSEIMSLIKALSPFVHYSGYVTDEQLAQLYSDASLFIYPSFYEGFGIPPLEAMACGAPVICSNTSTLPEVCADAAYYVDPHDCQAITESIKTVLHDESLKMLLRKKGLAHSQQFSWEKSAMEHHSLFQKLLQD